MIFGKLRKQHLFALGVCLCACAAVHAQPATLRVMTYNIHHGEGLDGKLDLERIAAIIGKAKVDVVALQEVDQGVKRTAKRDLPAELAELTGMNVYFERNLRFQGGNYGNAILTKLPIVEKKNTHFKMLREGEQRGLLHVVLNINGKEVHFMNTHLDHRKDESERLLNVTELKALVGAAEGRPIILCGDFNAEPDSRTHTQLRELLVDTWQSVGKGNGFTYPSDKPAKRIDYIWISKESIQPLDSSVIKSEASDHAPLVAELRIP